MEKQKWKETIKSCLQKTNGTGSFTVLMFRSEHKQPQTSGCFLCGLKSLLVWNINRRQKRRYRDEYNGLDGTGCERYAAETGGRQP